MVRSTRRDAFSDGIAQAKNSSDKDVVLPPSQNRFLRDTVLDFEQIHMREYNVRDFKPRWALELAVNISKNGLRDAIGVDANYVLIYGHHRYHASRLVSLEGESRKSYFHKMFALGENPITPTEDDFAMLATIPDDVWEDLHGLNKIPVTIKFNVDSKKNPVEATMIEVCENEWRSNHDERDVHRLIARLEELGYYLPTGGRPSTTETRINMRPLLEDTLRISGRHLRRIINEHEEKIKTIDKKATIKKMGKSITKFKAELNRVKTTDREYEVVASIDEVLTKIHNYLSEE